MTTSAQHAYLSTACRHGECGSCRNTCKFCESPCQHGCHLGVTRGQVAAVDQAREIARELYQAADITSDRLRTRIDDDPALFWLRGEQPPGVHPG